MEHASISPKKFQHGHSQITITLILHLTRMKFRTAYRSLSDLTLIYCGKAEFGQILRSFSLNSGAIVQHIHAFHPFGAYAKIFSGYIFRLKRPKNLLQIGFPSPRSVKSDRLLDSLWLARLCFYQ
jgi:hypothetical protein